MAYFILDKESKEFNFFGSLPVMVKKYGLDKSNLEYHFSRKKQTKFENEKYKIYKGDLERGGKKIIAVITKIDNHDNGASENPPQNHKRHK